MERESAYKLLRLDPSADGRMVESAYWTLVRQAQSRSSDDVATRVEIDDLNAAYTLLSPDGKTFRPKPQQVVVETSGLPFLDRIADWVAEEGVRTRARWARRNPEIGIIAGAAMILMLLALGAGASIPAVFLAMGVLLAVIWAPWRKPD